LKLHIAIVLVLLCRLFLPSRRDLSSLYNYTIQIIHRHIPIDLSLVQKYVESILLRQL
jgi:hypothetical protein